MNMQPALSGQKIHKYEKKTERKTDKEKHSRKSVEARMIQTILTFTERDKFCKMIPVTQSFFGKSLNNRSSLLKWQSISKMYMYQLFQENDKDIYIWIIKKSERCTVRTEEVPDRFIIDLQCWKLQNKFPFLVL